jgi:hypothetical protein
MPFADSAGIQIPFFKLQEGIRLLKSEKFWKEKKKVYLFELERRQQIATNSQIACKAENVLQFKRKFKNACNIKSFAICDTCAEKGLSNHTLSAQPKLVRPFL